MSRVSELLLLVVVSAVLSAVVAQQRLTRDQQLLPYQQQEALLRQQQQTQWQQQQQQSQQLNRQAQTPPQPSAVRLPNATGPPGSLADVDPTAKLIIFTKEDIGVYLKNEESVQILTECFLAPNLRDCPLESAKSLIRQIRRLGFSGQCNECDPEQQKHMHELFYEFVRIYSTTYKEYWQKLIPKLGFILNPPKTT